MVCVSFSLSPMIFFHKVGLGWVLVWSANKRRA